MNRTVFWAVVVSMGMTPSAWGNGTRGVPAPAPSMERLIEQLGAEEYTARDAADKALLALGSKALPALRKAKAHEDPEVRRRVGELLLTLERADLLAPKRVTLRLTNRPLRQAVTELAKQTGYKVELWPDAASNGEREKLPYSFQLDDVPFWTALDKVCAAGSLVLQEGYGDDHLRLHYQESRVPFIHHHGPFRMVAQGFHYSRSINFGVLPKDSPELGQRSEYLSFSFSVSVEPRLPLLGVGPAKLSAAQDDRNNLMHPPEANNPNEGPQYFNGGYRSFCQQTQVNLFRASRDARMARLIRGTVPVTLLVEQKPGIIVDKILMVKGKKFKAGDTDLDIEEVKDNGGKTYQVKMTVRKADDKNPNDYTWRNSLHQRLELQDAQGNKYQSQGYADANFTATGVQGSFLFGDPGNVKLGPPAKLVYYTWVMMQHTIAFEFKDLPLP